jgi:hypothetical protein
MTRRRRDARAQVLIDPPGDAVAYRPPEARTGYIVKLVGTDDDRLTRPGDRGL